MPIGSAAVLLHGPSSWQRFQHDHADASVDHTWHDWLLYGAGIVALGSMVYVYLRYIRPLKRRRREEPDDPGLDRKQ